MSAIARPDDITGEPQFELRGNPTVVFSGHPCGKLFFAIAWGGEFETGGRKVMDRAPIFAPRRYPKQARDGREFRFSVDHVPLQCCSAHSQIVCVASGSPEVELGEPLKKTREQFRAALAGKAVFEDAL